MNVVLADWLDEILRTSRLCYVKRLSANDTLASGSHQVGPYIPKQVLLEAIPVLGDATRFNPDAQLSTSVDSHGDNRITRAIWYNGRVLGRNTRNEARITKWGGESSPLMDAENTGAVALFAFSEAGGETGQLRVWVCGNPLEEELVEDRFGVIEPGTSIIWRPSSGPDLITAHAQQCRLTSDQLPAAWLSAFPSGADIVSESLRRRPLRDRDADDRLIGRRSCEFDLFLSIEEAIEIPRITLGFSSIDDFVMHAQRVLQRRKARSGRSLELQAREIFKEEGLVEGRDFSHQPESEPGKRPDFIFPSQAAYADDRFPSSKLLMLAVKTTCRDRWRQVLNEADRIPVKHVLTLQEGVSIAQHNEMRASGVRLVVPSSLVDAYPDEVKPHLQTLGSFIDQARSASAT